MRYSKLFGKTLIKPPKEAETISHQLLTQAGFIDHQLGAGIYTYLPLGWRVFKKIEQIIREEMNDIGSQELFMPSLQPKELWLRSKRWESFDPPLFVVKDRHHKELALAPTHEEVITDLVARFIRSYKDLPLALYHIQNKFRNEMRATGGLLRVREFFMKDLYSFHTTDADFEKFYWQVAEAYKKIFVRCGFVTKIVEAVSGSIGGSTSHEFMMLCQTGEDKIIYCPKCDWAANVEKAQDKTCPKCGAKTEKANCIENGHIFKLGTKYSESLGAYFVDKKGEKKPMIMGCYGIGLGRILATVVEAHHDKKGIIWPKSVAPFSVHLIGLEKMEKTTETIYRQLEKVGIEVLWDDRNEVSAGVKFADADLIGIPVRLVISEKTLRQDSGQAKVEWKERDKQKIELLSLEQVKNRLAND